MSTNFVTLQISAPTYWGYNIKVLQQTLLNSSLEDIIHLLKSDMKIFFEEHNLMELKDGVDNLNLHIHQDIEPHHEIIYVCADHNHNNNAVDLNNNIN